MKLLLVLLFALPAFLSHAQKCEVSEDPFSNEKKVTYTNKSAAFDFKLVGDKLKLNLTYSYGGELNVFAKKGSEILYKLENGKTLSFKTDIDIAPISYVSAGGVRTRYVYCIELSKEQLKMLSKYRITHSKFPDMKGGTYDNEYPKALQKSMLKGASCILEHL